MLQAVLVDRSQRIDQLQDGALAQLVGVLGHLVERRDLGQALLFVRAHGIAAQLQLLDGALQLGARLDQRGVVAQLGLFGLDLGSGDGAFAAVEQRQLHRHADLVVVAVKPVAHARHAHAVRGQGLAAFQLDLVAQLVQLGLGGHQGRQALARGLQKLLLVQQLAHGHGLQAARGARRPLGQGGQGGGVRGGVLPVRLGLADLHGHLGLLQAQARAVIAAARAGLDLAAHDIACAVQRLLRLFPHLQALLRHQQVDEGRGCIVERGGHGHLDIGTRRRLALARVLHAQTPLAEDGQRLLDAPLLLARLAAV